MKLIGLPDMHGDLKRIQQLKAEISQADLVLLLGDITNFGKEEQMQEAIDLVKAINSTIITVPGNCDYPVTERIMDQTETNLNGKTRVIGDLLFVGLGASLPTPSNATPFEVQESYFETKLAAIESELTEDNPMILVSHQPPRDTLADSLGNGLHVGSTTVRQFIERHQPLVCFTGHIHEGQGIDTIGQTKVINPGPVFQGNYAYAEISRKIDCLEIRSV